MDTILTLYVLPVVVGLNLSFILLKCRDYLGHKITVGDAISSILFILIPVVNIISLISLVWEVSIYLPEALHHRFNKKLFKRLDNEQ